MIDIKFNIDGLTTGDKRLDFGSENEISTLYRLLVERLNDLNIQIPQNVKENYPNIDFPTSVDIKILMVDNNEIFKDYFDNDSAKKTLGFFNLINSKNILGATETPDEFIVVIEADINNFNRIYNDYAKILNITKEDMLSRYLVTLTHEISHAVEFIENSGGLTPFVVEELFEKDLFEYEVDTCATGYGVSKYHQDYDGVKKEDDAQITDIMEDRVELKGRKLYHQLNISSAELSNVLGEQTINAKPKRKRTV
jgi:hypothetical protein